MKTYKNIYSKIYDKKNLILAYKKARKGKSKKEYVKSFEKNLGRNLLNLREELINQIYKPKPLVNFVLRDPKTRTISKSSFRDRIVHHAICNIIEPIFDKTFIFDSCANRKGKGNLFAIKRFDKFKRKVTNNLSSMGYCLKCDIKHYFKEVNHQILLSIIQNKINDEKIIGLMKIILENNNSKKGMPLGNLTSQFFANIYLNELDYFAKHKLKAKYYVRYVDDFIILNKDKNKLEIWKTQIEIFLKEKLKIELHLQKSRIIPLSGGVDFVGFRNFYYFRLLRKRSINSIKNKINKYNLGEITSEKILEVFQGWNAYASWANSYKLRLNIFSSLVILNLKQICWNILKGNINLWF